MKLTDLLTIVLYCTVGISLTAAAALADGQLSDSARISRAEALRLGERMYRTGIPPSGKPADGIAKGDVRADGNIFSCEGCHLRGGLGSIEGVVVTPPTNAATLFQPKYYGRELTPAERSRLSKHFQTPVLRPAYTDETLAIALRDGIGPTGKELNSVMPRYPLNTRDMEILITYLKTLSAEPSPGVTDTTIRFATVISDEVPPEDRSAMLDTLENFVADWNSKAKVYEARAKYLEIAQEADLSYRRMSLARWELKGPPATWRSQLEAYLRKEPVFALLGGISTEEWKPVHEFSEEHRIPCIFPITDLPVISESDWYTQYFSKGLYQEGETAARALIRGAESASEESVLLISRDTKEGRALAAGFLATWQEPGSKPPVHRVLTADEPLTKELIQQLTDACKPSVILLWVGAEAVPALEIIAKGKQRPRAVYVSSSLLQNSLWTLKDSVREFTRITYPYRLPREEAMIANYAKTWLQKRHVPVNDRKISTRMYSLMLLVSDTMTKMRRNFYRDHFLDLISFSTVHNFPDFEDLSFGPGQRYASKGGYIVELSRGPKPILIRKSDWEVR